MKLFTVLLSFLFPFFLAACGGGGGDPFNPSITLYSGNYSGADSGSMRITIDSRGNVSGQATSADSGAVFSISGNTSSSQVSFTAASTTTSLVFTGTLDSSTGLMTGSWHYAGSTVGGSFSARE